MAKEETRCQFPIKIAFSLDVLESSGTVQQQFVGLWNRHNRTNMKLGMVWEVYRSPARPDDDEPLYLIKATHTYDGFRFQMMQPTQDEDIWKEAADLDFEKTLLRAFREVAMAARLSE